MPETYVFLKSTEPVTDKRDIRENFAAAVHEFNPADILEASYGEQGFCLFAVFNDRNEEDAGSALSALVQNEEALAPGIDFRYGSSDDLSEILKPDAP